MILPILFILFSTTAYSAKQTQSFQPAQSLQQAQSPQQAAEALHLSDEITWHRLLHYRKTLFNTLVSDADGSDFFFAKNGKTDPKAELNATLSAFVTASDPSDLQPGQPPVMQPDKRPHCRFPARFNWLNSKLDLAQYGFINTPCPEYKKWRTVMDGGSATLVFASAFTGSPASMFGHTFLRIDKRSMPGQVLLSNIINYAANPTTKNPIAYAWLGLTGGFKGNFSALPYYIKVQEYGLYEARDLWEYPLNFQPQHIDQLLAHIWEMEQTHFDYYYIDENCSFHLLSLLEVANPSLQLTARFSGTVIPIDTVRALLAQKGLVNAPVFRPSHVSKMIARYNLLTPQERILAVTLAMSKKTLFDTPAPSLSSFSSYLSLTPVRQAWVLDAAHDYLKYNIGFYQTAKTDAEKWSEQREAQLLRERAKLSVSTPLLLVPQKQHPESGHPTLRVGLGFTAEHFTLQNRVQNTVQNSFALSPSALRLQIRTTLHDLLDRPQGYTSGSAIQLAHLIVRLRPPQWDQDGPAPTSSVYDRVLVERLDFANVTAISPIMGWAGKLSWRVNGFYGASPLNSCQAWRCTTVNIGGGVGAAILWKTFFPTTLYTFTDLYGSVAPWWDGKPRDADKLGVDVALGTLLSPAPWWQILAEARLKQDLLGNTHSLPLYIDSQLALQISPNQRFGIRLTLLKRNFLHASDLANQDISSRHFSSTMFLYF